tara:strand:+ start:183 stop:422 length:240 start_codon:yes stop_codon:yes gene_type:complete
MKQSDRDFYTEELKNYKTSSSKKSFLTRSRKECQEHLKDINWALTHDRPMLHGEPKHYGHAMEMEQEIDFINKLYSKIK